MHSISQDKRRATRDLDLDFIKYSLEDKSIINFIDKVDDGIHIEIVGKITRYIIKIIIYVNIYINHIMESYSLCKVYHKSLVFTRLCGVFSG